MQIGNSDIRQMSVEQKLGAIEAIWDDLLHGNETVESPAWHSNALAETEKRVQTGEVDSIEWGHAKADLRSR